MHTFLSSSKHHKRHVHAHIKPPKKRASSTPTQTQTTSGTRRNAAETMHRYESFGGLTDDGKDNGLDTTYLPPSPSPGPRIIRQRPALDGQDDGEETFGQLLGLSKKEAEGNLRVGLPRLHFSSSSSSASPPPPTRRPPQPMPPPPRPPTQPIHITLTRLPTLTAHQPALAIRINTIRRRLPPSSHHHSNDNRTSAIRAAHTALSTTRARLAAVLASFGMRDRDAIVDWDAIDAALLATATNATNAVDNDDDDDDNGGGGSSTPPPPPPIDQATQREVEGWLARTMGWYTGRGSMEVYPEDYDDDDGEAAAGRPQRQRGAGMSCMIKGRCEMRAVFASETQMQAVVRAIEAPGAMGDGVGLMGMVLRFWNEEWRVENPDLAIEGDDLGVGDMLRLSVIRPLEREWEE